MKKAKNIFKEFENHVEVYKDGYTAYFDKEDFYKFNGRRIYFHKNIMSGKEVLDLKTFLNGKKRSIARLIMNESRSEFVVDHINGNRLDTRKSNLRSITFSENTKNKFTYSNNSKSKISGVTYSKKDNSWVARIQVDGKRIFLGSSKNFEKVVLLRKQAEKRYFNDIKKHWV